MATLRPSLLGPDRWEPAPFPFFCRDHFMRNDVSDESFFFHLETDLEEMNNLFPSGLEAETRLQNDLIQWIETSRRARSELVSDGSILDEGIRRKPRALGCLQ